MTCVERAQRGLVAGRFERQTVVVDVVDDSSAVAQGRSRSRRTGVGKHYLVVPNILPPVEFS